MPLNSCPGTNRAPKVSCGYEATQIIDLPLELWRSICQSLRKDDIRSTRLACSLFNDAASPFFSSSSEDQKTLTAISVHPIYSKYIKQMYYDCTIYDPALIDDFNDVRYSRKCVRKFPEKKSNAIWPK